MAKPGQGSSYKSTSKRTAAKKKYDFLWRMFADTVLSFTGKVVATTLLLKFHNTKTGQCNPSIATIAKAIGRGRRTTFYAITELKETGWITVKSTGGGSSRNTDQFDFDFERLQSIAPVGVQESAPEQDFARGVQDPAHEPSRTTRAFGAGGGGREKTSQRAPDGALEKFEQLRQLWQRPYGTNEEKALAAFNRLIGDGVAPELILESARRWVAVREPAFLPKLETWLDDGAWRNNPPVRQTRGQRKPSAAEVAAGLAEAAARDEGGDGW
jgi:helix-turn-helix protein